ncbi:hypothetical protein NM688_g3106 [Phlebia brevispora]|uniref:Uncharacterized protein n=1 Tax=Phlebia brevispora TaxID=194682 RepID=A0ACC1T6W4_9APHY|nr:hypothetical protein NM688_g3106 [Phlebia brevispora]
MAEPPNGNPNRPDSTDRLALPTSFKRSFDQLALDFEGEDSQARSSSSSSSGLNSSLGPNTERNKRARSESEHEPANSSSAGTSSARQDVDVDMTDGIQRSHRSSPSPAGLMDDLTPALAHIPSSSSSSSTVTTAGPASMTTHTEESRDPDTSVDNFRLSMERYTTFDDNISALRNSNAGISANPVSDERPASLNPSPSRSEASPTPVSSSAPVARSAAEGVNELHDRRRDRVEQEPSARTSFADRFPGRFPPSGWRPSWVTRRHIPEISRRNGERDLFSDAANQRDFLIDLTAEDDRRESSSGATTSSPAVGHSEPHTVHYHDWTFDPWRRDALSLTDPDPDGRSRILNAVGDTSQGLQGPGSRSISSRSRSVDENPSRRSISPAGDDDRTYLRNAIATLTERSEHEASSDGIRAEDQLPDYGPRTVGTDIEFERLRQGMLDLERERERTFNEVRVTRERLHRVLAQGPADMVLQQEANRSHSPLSYYPPPSELLEREHQILSVLYHIHYITHPSAYILTLGTHIHSWPYRPVPPMPLTVPPPLPFDLMVDSRPPSPTETIAEDRTSEVRTSDTSNGGMIASAAELANATRRRPLSPHLPFPPPLFAPPPSWISDEHARAPSPTPSTSADAPLSPRSRTAQRLPPWLTPAPGALAETAPRAGRMPQASTHIQRAPSVSSPLRHGFTASRTASPTRVAASPAHPSTHPRSAGPSADDDENVARIIDLLSQSITLLQRMASASRTSIPMREAIQRVIDSQRDLTEILRRRNGRARLQQDLPPPIAPLRADTGSVETTSGRGSPLDGVIRRTIPVNGAQAMEVDSASGLQIPTLANSTNSAQAQELPPTTSRYTASGTVPTGASGFNGSRNDFPNWTDRLAELTSVNRASSSALPIRHVGAASFRRPQTNSLTSPERRTEPLGMPVSASVSFRRSSDVPSARPTDDTPLNADSVRSRTPRDGREEVNSRPAELQTTFTARSDQVNVTDSGDHPPPNHRTSTAHDRRLAIDSITCPFRAAHVHGMGMGSPRRPPGSQTSDSVTSIPTTGTPLPSLPTNTPRNAPATRASIARTLTSLPEAGSHRQRRVPLPTYDESSYFVPSDPDPLEPYFFSMPRQRGADSRSTDSHSSVTGGSRAGSNNELSELAASAARVVSQGASSANADLPRMDVDRDSELDSIFPGDALRPLPESLPTEQTTHGADAMAVDSTAPARNTSMTQAPGAADPAGRAPTASSAFRDDGPSMLEGIGTRTPVVSPAATRTRGSAAPAGPRSAPITLSGYADGPIRDSIARTRALQSRRATHTTPDSARGYTVRPLFSGRETTSGDATTTASRSTTTNEANRALSADTLEAWLSAHVHFPEPANREPQSSRHGNPERRPSDSSRPAGTSGSAAARSDVQNANRERREALERYREEQRRASRLNMESIEAGGPLVDLPMPPWDRLRSTVERRERDSSFRERAVARHYHDWAATGDRDGGFRAFRRVSRDDEPVVYDWMTLTDTDGWFPIQFFTAGSRSRGTPESVVNGLPSGTYGAWAVPGETEERCPICFDDYQTDDPVLKLPNCSHWFHKPCLQQWLKNARTCPVCRARVTNEEPGSSTAARHHGSTAMYETTMRRVAARRRGHPLPQDVPSFTDVPFATLRTPTSNTTSLPHPSTLPPPTTFHSMNFVPRSDPPSSTTATSQTRGVSATSNTSSTSGAIVSTDSSAPAAHIGSVTSGTTTRSNMTSPERHVPDANPFRPRGSSQPNSRRPGDPWA